MIPSPNFITPIIMETPVLHTCSQVEPLKELCQHFLDCCIRDGSHCQTGGENGLEVVQVLEAACESLRNEGAKVEIKWD